jgi:hypothetical protein
MASISLEPCGLTGVEVKPGVYDRDYLYGAPLKEIASSKVRNSSKDRTHLAQSPHGSSGASTSLAIGDGFSETASQTHSGTTDDMQLQAPGAQQGIFSIVR